MQRRSASTLSSILCTRGNQTRFTHGSSRFTAISHRHDSELGGRRCSALSIVLGHGTTVQSQSLHPGLDPVPPRKPNALYRGLESLYRWLESLYRGGQKRRQSLHPILLLNLPGVPFDFALRLLIP